MINLRYRNRRVLSQIMHSRDFRFGLEARHEPTRDSRDDFAEVYKGDQITLSME